MKLTLPFLLLCSISIVSAISNTPQKAVLVSYSPDTPQSVLDSAMGLITSAGGMITHQYTLFKGFAANAPAKVLESVQAAGSSYQATVEDDQTVHAN